MRMYWKNLPMEYYDFKTKRYLLKYFPISSFHQCSGLLAVCVSRLHKLNYTFLQLEAANTRAELAELYGFSWS